MIVDSFGICLAFGEQIVCIFHDRQFIDMICSGEIMKALDNFGGQFFIMLAFTFANKYLDYLK